ncbi:MAG: phage tail assembly protein [Synergistaceae bacterium]|nr:phage tail assembly protein [Synergistaceae bacterium]
MKIQLTKAIKHKGQDVFTLDIPLDDLTGNDLIEVEEEIIRAGGSPFSATDFSRGYLIAVAARAAHFPVEALKMMNAKDFSRVVTEVRNFLIVTDSETQTTNEDSVIQANTPEIS